MFNFLTEADQDNRGISIEHYQYIREYHIFMESPA